MSVDTKAVINPNTGQVKSVFNVEREPFLCPVCGIEVDYLVGDDLGDGRRGCEACWRPPTTGANSPGSIPAIGKPATAAPAEAPAPDQPDQLADFDRAVKQEYGQPSPPMPGVPSSPLAAVDSDFQQFRQGLIEEIKKTDGGDTNG